MRSLLAAAVFALAVPMFAVSYVVPADRFEIERSTAIVVGHAVSSRVESSPRLGIETITVVVVEESIKGDAGAVVEIHEPGGELNGEAWVIPGVPEFAAGERVLLFLHQRDDGAYAVTDLQLGLFRFARDLVVRNESEIGHKERHRSAERFIEYVRSVVRGEPAEEDYFVAAASTAETMPPRSDAAFTASSYTVALAGGFGARWNVFPSAVNWNRGNSETGVLGNGAAQINSAFNAWDAGGAHYVLTASNANANGILEAADGINNVVFEKNLTSAGIQPYSCTQGGVLGMGGIHSIVGTHSFNGETFSTTKEVDVSMNQGLGSCSLAQFPTEAFYTTVTHEVGHTLGFRHSDQTRLQNAPCSSDPSLDCSNSAVMDHLLILGLNGQLQPWDSSAVSHVYGAVACTPPSIAVQPSGATIGAGGSAQLSVAAAGTPPLVYQWFAGVSGNTSTPVSAGNPISVSPAITTSYWVRVTGQCAPVADSAAAIVTVVPCPAVTLGPAEAAPVGSGFTLSVNAAGGSGFTWTWFQGAASGAGSPVGYGNHLVVHPSKTTSYWCRVTNNCNKTSDSSVVTVTVLGRRRAARSF